MAAWFRRKTDGSEGKPSRVDIAEGLWIKCDSCKEIVYRAEVERAGRVCPKCLYPFRVSARERVALLADPGTFEERDTNLETTDPLGFRDTKKYRDRVRAAVEKTKTDEAVVTGVARTRSRYFLVSLKPSGSVVSRLVSRSSNVPGSARSATRSRAGTRKG